ncbi:hypothetical protein KACC15558_05950 [Brevibacterium ammoniilyticum]|uniref:Uncharacterized protein n=1 Tax=Brevibacterium ammoniilyticum TaxID=1046555 RepID=A0ABP9TWG2_9MICO
MGQDLPEHRIPFDQLVRAESTIQARTLPVEGDDSDENTEQAQREQQVSRKPWHHRHKARDDSHDCDEQSSM